MSLGLELLARHPQNEDRVRGGLPALARIRGLLKVRVGMGRVLHIYPLLPAHAYACR